MGRGELMQLVAPTIWSVSDVTGRVAAALQADPLLGSCAVRGEISNHKAHSSGHHYFTLKDADAEIKCVMFRSAAQRLRFRAGDGLSVICLGRVEVYAPRGMYQLYVESMQPDGQGTLAAAFERLRDQLAGEGLFDEANKRPLPRCPKRVALITSADGAAVRDMIRVLRGRWPAVRITLAEAAVQGEQAAPSLVRALRLVNRRDDVDVILLGRGGGSMEDLWAFNEEPVARAIAASRIPVISAVGHETDFTIADFVADLRAATPTHAAQLAVPDAGECGRAVGELAGRLRLGLQRRVASLRLRHDMLVARAGARAPGRLLARRRQQLDEWDERLGRSLAARLAGKRERLRGLGHTLGALSPQAVLRRGYAILTRDADGCIVTAPCDLPAGESATARLADGTLAVVSRGEVES